METLQAETSLQGIQVNPCLSFCRNECIDKKERRSLGSLFHNKVLKNAGLFAPADLLTRGIISEVYMFVLWWCGVCCEWVIELGPAHKGESLPCCVCIGKCEQAV